MEGEEGVIERRDSLTGTKYWVISGDPRLVDVFKLDLDGLGKTLPVFSFKEEAEMFLKLGGLDEGWWAGESGVDDLATLLLGDGADVESVVLDPLPAMLADSTVGLVALSLRRFVDRFLAQDGFDVRADAG